MHTGLIQLLFVIAAALASSCANRRSNVHDHPPLPAAHTDLQSSGPEYASSGNGAPVPPTSFIGRFAQERDDFKAETWFKGPHILLASRGEMFFLRALIRDTNLLLAQVYVRIVEQSPPILRRELIFKGGIRRDGSHIDSDYIGPGWISDWGFVIPVSQVAKCSESETELALYGNMTKPDRVFRIPTLYAKEFLRVIEECTTPSDSTPSREQSVTVDTIASQEASRPKKPKRSDIIKGRWTFAAPLIPSDSCIIERDGMWLIESRYRDGTKSTRNLTLVHTPAGEKYTVTASANGDYYLICKDGSIKAGDKEGVTAVFQPTSDK